MSKISKRFGAELRRRREEMGLTQRVLADRIGTTPGYISRIEKGGETVSRPLLTGLLGALGIPAGIDGRRTKEIKMKTKATTRTSRKPKERAVLVTTEFRGVFFGYATDTSGDTIHLRAARNCIYWSRSVGGFVGLAERGPDAQCRIGARADLDLRKITCVAEMTAAAVRAWEGAPCVS